MFSICQTNYIKKMLKEFAMEDSRPSKIPMDPGYYRLERGQTLPNNNKYREAIGSLLYLAVNTRPDIMASVTILSQCVSCPTTTDWTEVKRIFRYLKHTEDYKLRLGGNSEELHGFCDADWAGDRSDRKSKSGYLFKYKGAALSWSSRKQSCITLSSTEAEYVALSEACQESKWLRQLMEDLGEPLTQPITLYEDNQSCIKLVDSEKMRQRTKHVDVRFHFCREMKISGEIDVKYCPGTEMMADGLTKPVAWVKLAKLVNVCNLLASRGGVGNYLAPQVSNLLF